MAEEGEQMVSSLGYIVGLRLDSVRPCLKKKKSTGVFFFPFRTVEYLNGKISSAWWLTPCNSSTWRSNAGGSQRILSQLATK